MKMILFPSCMVMLGVFGMIWSAVVLVRQKRFFTSAPRDIQAAILDRPPRFPGAVQLGYGIMLLCVALCIAAFVWVGYDGLHHNLGFSILLRRYAAILYLYELFDILFLDWYLLTKSGFYQHFYPETIGCAGYHSFGFNWKGKVALAVAIPLLAGGLAGLTQLVGLL